MPKNKHNSNSNKQRFVMVDKQRFAMVDIIGRGDPVRLPIVDETSHGFICRTGKSDSPATEFFAFKSVAGSAVECQ